MLSHTKENTKDAHQIEQVSHHLWLMLNVIDI